jgi:hypothetical protein
MKIDDGHAGIRLRSGQPGFRCDGAASELPRLQKSRAGQIFEAGTEEQPAVPTDESLFVACTQPCQCRLHPGAHPLAQRRGVLEIILEAVHLPQQRAIGHQNPREPGPFGVLKIIPGPRYRCYQVEHPRHPGGTIPFDESAQITDFLTQRDESDQQDKGQGDEPRRRARDPGHAHLIARLLFPVCLKVEVRHDQNMK